MTLNTLRTISTMTRHFNFDSVFLTVSIMTLTLSVKMPSVKMLGVVLSFVKRNVISVWTDNNVLLTLNNASRWLMLQFSTLI
jgi:hypothetical protein